MTVFQDRSLISVIGLGYVGLPLAMALSKHYPVIGFDISKSRISELRDFDDRSGEVKSARLRASTVELTDDSKRLSDCDIHIVAVPTPVHENNDPDLSPILSACEIVGTKIKKGAVVVFECTVYPGLTEEVCGPALESASGMICGEDFFLGYSPERVNPGDSAHSLDRVTKVIAGQTDAVVDILRNIYGEITGNNVFVAKDIRTAEAAKVTENAQRDINIAFVNELAMIFDAAGLSTQDVLAAAETKWNFAPFKPGLVGGHCISVDPYYLADFSRRLGHEPEVILTGRRINESVPRFVANRLSKFLNDEPSKVLMLGLTFKENISDLRNSKAAEVVRHLTDLGHTVHVHDPHADPHEAKKLYGISLISRVDSVGPCQCIIGGVRHEEYSYYTSNVLQSLLTSGGVLADLKGMWRHLDFDDRVLRWNL